VPKNTLMSAKQAFYSKVLSILAIFSLGILVYSNTFYCPFNFDDELYIVYNFAIKHIHDVLSIWTYYPCRFVTFYSLALNFYCNHYHVFGYHLVNLMIHLISAMMVWWFMRLTLSTPVIKDKFDHAHVGALLVALVFVAHPLQTEAVTYICQRAASMAAMFYLASICFYIQSRLISECHCEERSDEAIYYFFSLLAAILAMFSKETAITLPLMILLYELSFFEHTKGLNWKPLFPFLLMLVIIPITTLFNRAEMFQTIEGVVKEGISPVHYFLTELRVMLTYVRLLFFPFNQNLDYEYPVYKSIFEFPVWSSLLLLIALLGIALKLFREYRLISFSIFWFFLTLLPESSFLPQQDLIFEHRLYLPMVGYSLFLVSSVYYFISNVIASDQRERGNLALIILLSLIIGCYSIMTYQRNEVWKDDLTLWNDIVHKSPHKARAYGNRGLLYYNQGNYTLALQDLNKAIALNPYYSQAYNNRGLIYSHEGNLGLALTEFTHAIEVNSSNAEPYSNRGLVYIQGGNLSQALTDFTQVLELNPNDPQALSFRGYIEDKEGNDTQALKDLNQSIELEAHYEDAYINRGTIYFHQGEYVQAMTDFNRALELNPQDPLAQKDRAITALKMH